MARRVIGLDVGTYSIKVVHLEGQGRNNDVKVVQYAEKKLEPLQATEGQDASSVLLESQVAALMALKADGLFDGFPIVTGLKGADAQVRSLTMPFADTKKIDAVLSGVLDAQLPMDVEDLIVTWFLQKKTGDENKLLVAYARREAIAAHLALLGRAQIDPRSVVLTSGALFDLYERRLCQQLPEGDQGSSIVVEIGHTSTNFCLIRNGELEVARAILRGGADATQLIAERLEISSAAAEEKKHQAFIEIGENKGKLLEEHLLSEAMKLAYQPQLREIKQMELALRQTDQRIDQIFLVGGGSRIRHLDLYLAETLQIPIRRVDDLGEIGMSCPPQAASALSYALQGLPATKKPMQFNFRREEFAFKGEYNLVRSRVRPLVIWVLIALSVFGIYGLTRASMLGKEVADLKAEQLKVCESVIGQKVDSATQCLKQIKERVSGKGVLAVADFSAVDVYLEIPRVVPSDLQIKVTDLDITDKAVRMGGETGSFELIDRLVESLARGHCFSNIDKGRARQTATGVGFQITFDLDCSAQKDK